MDTQKWIMAIGFPFDDVMNKKKQQHHKPFSSIYSIDTYFVTNDNHSEFETLVPLLLV